MPWGTSSATRTRPATASRGSHFRSYERTVARPGTTELIVPPVTLRLRSARPAPGDELAELPQPEQCHRRYHRPPQLLKVQLLGPQDPVERVHLRGHHREHELRDRGPVHLLAVERRQVEHRLRLAPTLERPDDQAEGEGRERDGLPNCEAAVHVLPDRDQREEPDGDGEPHQSDGEQEARR